MRMYDARLVLLSSWITLAGGMTYAQAPEHPVALKDKPGFTIMPQDEDWSRMRDPALRSNLLDRIKYISIGHHNSYLSLGGQARGAFERIQNDNWSPLPVPTNSFALQRYQLHLDAHLLPQLRLFLQLESGLEEGRQNGPRPIDAKRLDFLNAFADLKLGATSHAPRIRIGKQELNYGSGRAVAVREGPNVRQAFYGVRVDEAAGRWQSSGFAVRPALDHLGYFDGVPDHATQFWGWFNTRSWEHFSHFEFDAYYLGLDRKNASFNQGSGREVRHTVGARIASEPPAMTGSRHVIPHYDIEAAYQGGTFDNGSIHAWTLSSESGLLLPTLPWKPRLGMRADISSGDRSSQNKNLQTFNALFPIGNYFGILADTGPGPANIRDLHPSLRLTLSRKIDVFADWLFWWRDSLQDGVYNVPGNLLVGAGKSHARFVGKRPGIEAHWQIDRHTYLQADYGVFFAGAFLKESGFHKNLNYTSVALGYRF